MEARGAGSGPAISAAAAREAGARAATATEVVALPRNEADCLPAVPTAGVREYLLFLCL